MFAVQPINTRFFVARFGCSCTANRAQYRFWLIYVPNGDGRRTSRSRDSGDDEVDLGGIHGLFRRGILIRRAERVADAMLSATVPHEFFEIINF